MLEDLFRRLNEWWRVQSGIERLRGLDDRLLADMGVVREEIVAFAKGDLKPEPAELPVRARVVIASPHPRITRRRPGTAYVPARGRAVIAQQMENCQ